MARRIALFLLLAGALAMGQEARAQEQAPPAERTAAPPEKGEVFAPFVSRLKARAVESGEAGVVLSWRRSADLDSWTRIYRHTAEIDAATFDAAELIARLEPDRESYTDFPPSQGNWFYAVALEDPEGNPYRLFIPFRNKISFGVAVQRTGTEESLASEIRGLDARVAAAAVNLSFRSSRPQRELLLFRSTEPIRTPDDLLAAVAPTVLPEGATSWTDNPVPGVDYWYALVDAGQFRLGKAELLPGENTTTRAVQVALQSAAADGAAAGAGLPAAAAVRPVPLPLLLIGSGVEGATRLAPASPFLIPDTRVKVGPATARAVGELLATLPASPPAARAVQVLPVDASAASGGEAEALKTILVERLQSGDYAGSAGELRRFLSVHRSPEIEARVHFYLGQSEWFRQRPREALLEFLLAEDLYYRDVQPWMDDCLRLLAATGGGSAQKQ